MRIARILVDDGIPPLCRVTERADGRLTLHLATLFAPPDRFRVEFLATGEVVSVARSSFEAGVIDVVVMDRRAA